MAPPASPTMVLYPAASASRKFPIVHGAGWDWDSSTATCSRSDSRIGLQSVPITGAAGGGLVELFICRELPRRSQAQSRRAFGDVQCHAMAHVYRRRVTGRHSFAGGKPEQRELPDRGRAADHRCIAFGSDSTVMLAQRWIRRESAAHADPS